MRYRNVGQATSFWLLAASCAMVGLSWAALLAIIPGIIGARIMKRQRKEAASFLRRAVTRFGIVLCLTPFVVLGTAAFMDIIDPWP